MPELIFICNQYYRKYTRVHNIIPPFQFITMPVQRRGMRALQIWCSRVTADYKDVEFLIKHLGPQGQIKSRARTGYGAQDQKSLKRAIKRARHLALLPFVG